MVVVAQLGARMHYAVPRILHRAGMLERLYTDIYAPQLPRPFQTWASRFGPAPVRRLLGRVPAEIPTEKVVSFAAMGIEYYRRKKFAAHHGSMAAAPLWAGQEFCRRVIRHGLGEASCVFAYNSAGMELFQHARSAGVFSVMEQTFVSSQTEEDLLNAEELEHPRWQQPCAKDPLRPAFREREQMEWEAADVILCGSEFVRNSIGMSGGPTKRCLVVPYGVSNKGPRVTKDLPHRPLRVLSVGAVGLRKGAPYVLEAARSMKNKADFCMAGQIDVIPDAQQLLNSHIRLLGAVPRSEIHRQFEWADVFLLPTLCEGSATVCYEALSYGLPVITTPNAGSVVRDGVDGFIVPIRDAAAIVECIERLVDDRDLWTTMSANAFSRASEFTLERYGERLLSVFAAEQMWERVNANARA